VAGGVTGVVAGVVSVGVGGVAVGVVFVGVFEPPLDTLGGRFGVLFAFALLIELAALTLVD